MPFYAYIVAFKNDSETHEQFELPLSGISPGTLGDMLRVSPDYLDDGVRPVDRTLFERLAEYHHQAAWLEDHEYFLYCEL